MIKSVFNIRLQKRYLIENKCSSCAIPVANYFTTRLDCRAASGSIRWMPPFPLICNALLVTGMLMLAVLCTGLGILFLMELPEKSFIWLLLLGMGLVFVTIAYHSAYMESIVISNERVLWLRSFYLRGSVESVKFEWKDIQLGVVGSSVVRGSGEISLVLIPKDLNIPCLAICGSTTLPSVRGQIEHLIEFLGGQAPFPIDTEYWYEQVTSEQKRPIPDAKRQVLIDRTIFPAK